jgi:hypothetical protein
VEIQDDIPGPLLVEAVGDFPGCLLDRLKIQFSQIARGGENEGVPMTIKLEKVTGFRGLIDNPINAVRYNELNNPFGPRHAATGAAPVVASAGHRGAFSG